MQRNKGFKNHFEICHLLSSSVKRLEEAASSLSHRRKCMLAKKNFTGLQSWFIKLARLSELSSKFQMWMPWQPRLKTDIQKAAKRWVLLGLKPRKQQGKLVKETVVYSSSPRNVWGNSSEEHCSEHPSCQSIPAHPQLLWALHLPAQPASPTVGYSENQRWQNHKFS